MKKAIFFLISLLPFFLYSQDYPDSWKMRLRSQTTSKGLIAYGDGAPSYTPSTIYDLWEYQDTTNDVRYFYAVQSAAWQKIGINTAIDTAYIIQDSIIYFLRQDGTNWQDTILVGAGDMLKATYDPTNISDDAFDHVNMYGQYIDLDTTYGVITDQTGRIQWDSVDRTISIHTGKTTQIQVGQETVIQVYNNSGAQINNGQVVQVSGIFNDFPTISLAIATDHDNAPRDILIATADIPNGEYGFCVELVGKVRGLNTSGLSLGEVWLSATTPGAMTSTKPIFPDYQVSLGGVIKVDASNGIVQAKLDGYTPDHTIFNYFLGTVRESFDFTVASDGATITGTLERAGTGDMTLFFSDGFYTFDCTPAQTITLTAGTDAVPVTNYVYIPRGTKTLTVSTSYWPSEEHVKIADVILQSATATQNYDAMANRNWNDHLVGTDSLGGHAHVGSWIRNRHAAWSSGAAGTITIVGASSPDDVYFSNTGGQVFQKHLQSFEAKDMQTGDVMFVVNHPTTAYDDITNLNTQLTDASSGSLSGRYFNLVVWGVNNKGGESDQLMLNLPTGSYNSSATAISDISNYNVFDIPAEFTGKGFLIAKYTFQHTAAGGGQWTLVNTVDLRGKTPATAGGGVGGGGASDFLSLTDTPSSYSGEAGNVATVNGGETALEFTTIPVETVSDGNTIDFTLTGTDLTGEVIISADAGNRLSLGTDLALIVPAEVDGSITNELDTVTVLVQDSILRYTLNEVFLSQDTIRPPGSGAGAHDAVTLAGVYDYLTLSNQEITLNQIDLTTDVTGVLPSGNIGTHTHVEANITDLTHTDNTASSAGTGTSLFYQKSVLDLQFNAIKSENGLLTVALDAGTHDIELTVNETLIDHDNLTNFAAGEHFLQSAISIPLSQGANDVTATSSEVNLLDLAGLTTGWVLRATGAATAAWSQLNTSDLNNDSGFLTAEVDGSVSNEGSLTVGAGTTTTSLIQSNTSGSTDVTLSEGSNIELTEVGNTITIAATGFMTSFDIYDGTTTETISDGQTIEFQDGTGVDVRVLATDRVVVDYNGAITDQTDVSFTSLTANDIMQWNGADWVNVTTSSISDGNGIFTSANDGSTSPASMSVNVTDSLNFENKKLVVTTTGVGFGNTTTEAPVHVYGSSAGSVAIDANTLLTLEKGSSGYISFQGSGGAQGFLWADAADTDEARFYYNWGDNSMYLYANGAQEAVFAPTATTLGTYVFNTDQSVGAGTDNYVLTYDNGTGEIGLEVATGGSADGNGIFDATNDAATVPTTFDVYLTDKILFGASATLVVDGTNDVVGVNNNSPNSSYVLDVLSNANESAIMAATNVATTNVINEVARVVASTSGDMADGFGSSITFSIDDGATAYTDIAAIAATRNGADNTGAIEFYTDVAGVSAKRGELSNTILEAGNYTFNIDQTVGAGQDNYVLTYDNSSGEIGLEAAGGGSDGNGIFDATNDGETVPTGMDVLLTNTITFASGTLTIDGSNDVVGIGTPAPSSSYVLDVSGNTFETALRVKTLTTATNTVFDNTIFDATTSGTAADGFGPGLVFQQESTEIATLAAVRDGADNSGAIQLITNATGTPTAQLIVKSDGSIDIPDYGSGNNTGTEAYNLSVTSSGDVIETAVVPTVLVAYKTSDETINNDATLTNDTDLKVSAAANKIYSIEGFILFSADATPDLKYQLYGPSGWDVRWHDAANSTQAAYTSGDTRTGVGSGASNYRITQFQGVVTISSTAGDVGVKWCQDVSDAANTTLRKGAWIKLTLLN